APGEMHVNVLEQNSSFIDENAYGEGESAKRHNVDRLTCGPEGDHGTQQRKGNCDHDDERAAPVAQEEQQSEAGEDRSEHSFARHRPECVAHILRLVELVADLDVLRNERLKAGNAPSNFIDDREGRSIWAFGYGDVDGALVVQ